MNIPLQIALLVYFGSEALSAVMLIGEPPPANTTGRAAWIMLVCGVYILAIVFAGVK